MPVEAMEAPSSVSPPAKRQKMLSKACEYCKVKKLRCDSARPQCEHCSKKGQQCIYKERGQPGLRPGYGRDVERRLSSLEEKLERMDQTLQNSLMYNHMDNAPREALPSTNNQLLPAQNFEPETAWPAPQPPAQPPPGDMAVLSPSAVDSMAFSTNPDSHTSQGQPLIPDQQLPPAEVLVELTELFFIHIYPWAPLFDKATFIGNMWQVERQALLHGIVVVSMRFWDKISPSANMLQHYLQTSRDRLHLHCMETCSLITAQALTLLAIDALAQGPGTRIWMLRAMLGASVQQLGLTKELVLRNADANMQMVGNEGLDNDAEPSSIAAEERRRLFWTIFSLDHFISVALGQPSAIPARSIKLRYPCIDEQWYQPTTTEWYQAGAPVRSVHFGHAWRHYIDILTLLDRSNRLLIHPCDLSQPAKRQEWQSQFRMMTISLTTWLETCAEQCRNPNQDGFDAMWTIVRATYELINLRMYTVAAFPQPRAPEMLPSESAKNHCREAVRSVVALAKPLSPTDLRNLGPVFAFIVWVAARSLVILWTTGYEGNHQTKPAGLELLMNVLRQMTVYWPCAGRYLDILQFTLNTWQSNPGGTNTIQIFNDTRRTSYGLLLQLGPSARTQSVPELDFSDFFDTAFLEVGNPGWPTDVFGLGFASDWLL